MPITSERESLKRRLRELRNPSRNTKNGHHPCGWRPPGSVRPRLEGYPPTELHQSWESERSLNLSEVCVLNLGLIVSSKSSELRRVECVESFGTELRIDSLCDFERLVEGQVRVQIARTIAVRCAGSVAVGEGRCCSKRSRVDIVRQPAL